MPKIPSELRDPERDEQAQVAVTLLRGGWANPVMLPRWVAVHIQETVAQREAAKDARDQAVRERWMWWFAGFCLGVSWVFGAYGQFLLAALYMVISVAAMPAAREWVAARWDRWRDR